MLMSRRPAILCDSIVSLKRSVNEKEFPAGFSGLISPATGQLLIQINEVTDFRVFQE
jgi:hypothetical protein